MADILRLILIIVAIAMALLALFYLRRRHLSIFAALLWALLALVVPLVGPFLVIFLQPGSPLRKDSGKREGTEL